MGNKVTGGNVLLLSCTAALNVVETLMNLGYLFLAHIAPTPVAPLLGFASAVMTLSKTVLYWAQEYYCGGELTIVAMMTTELADSNICDDRLRCRAQQLANPVGVLDYSRRVRIIYAMSGMSAP